MAEFDSVIPAGGSGKLVAKVATKAGQMGRLSKTVSVSTDLPSRRALSLRVDMTVVTPVMVLPQMRLSVSGIEGQRTSDGVLLRRTDGEALRVEVDAPVEPLEVRILSAVSADASAAAARHKPQANDLWLELSAPETASAIARSGQLRLRTNHPEVPILEVPFMLRVRSMIEARPAQVRLWVSEGKQVATAAIVRLVHNGQAAFPVTSVATSHPEVFSAGLSASGEPSVAHNVWVRVVDDTDRLGLPIQGLVTVGVGGSPERTVTIPVVVAPRRVAQRKVGLEPPRSDPPSTAPGANGRTGGGR